MSNRILSAYHSGYWEAFLLFADMADELFCKGARKLVLPSSHEFLEQSCAQLETKIFHEVGPRAQIKAECSIHVIAFWPRSGTVLMMKCKMIAQVAKMRLREPKMNP